MTLDHLATRAAVGALFVVAALAPAAIAHGQGEPHDVVVVFDNSGSMRRNDPGHLATLAVQQFVERQPRSTRVALLMFDSTPRLLIPLTPIDAGAKRRFESTLLDEVDYRGRWTNLPTAIERALYHLRSDGRPDAPRSIIFLTDGRVDTGDAARDREQEAWLREGLADSAADAGIRLFGIAFTEDADYRVIESITRRTDGEYVRVFEPEALGDAFERIEAARATPVEEAEVEEPEETEPSEQATVEGEAPVAPPVPATGDSLPAERVRSNGGLDGALPYVIMIAIPSLTVLLLVLLTVARRRARAAGGASQGPGVDVPTAFLLDESRATGKVRHDLGEVTVIGRKPSDRDVVSIVIESDTVSRRHATIRFREGAFWINDHRTRNGTFVNGTRLVTDTRLEPGDRVRVDKFDFVFDVEAWSDEDATRFAEDDEATRFSYEADFAESPSSPS